LSQELDEAGRLRGVIRLRHEPPTCPVAREELSSSRTTTGQAPVAEVFSRRTRRGRAFLALLHPGSRPALSFNRLPERDNLPLQGHYLAPIRLDLGPVLCSLWGGTTRQRSLRTCRRGRPPPS
jgi:hypothetical protein